MQSQGGIVLGEQGALPAAAPAPRPSPHSQHRVMGTRTSAVEVAGLRGLDQCLPLR